MTVSSELNRKTFAGDAVTTSFGTSPVVFFDTSDLVVTVVDSSGTPTELVENTDYTVSGGDGSTGTVDLSTGSSPHGAVASGSTLVIVRTLPVVQETDFVQNDSSDAEVAEDALDKVIMIAQQLSARIARSFVLADSDVSGASTTLPTPEASTLLGWDDDGTALQNYSTSTLDAALTTAFTLTLLDDSNADSFVQTLVAALSAETAPAVDDVVLIGDTSEGKGNKMTLANALKVIDALTADTTPDVADEVVTYDASATAAKKVTLSNALKVVNGLTEDTTPDQAADYVLTYDASASGPKKALIKNLSNIVVGSPTATTSGTAVTVTGIPANAKRVAICFNGVSTNGTANVVLTIGPSGGVEGSGYLGTMDQGGTPVNFSSNFVLDDFGASAAVRHGKVVLELQNASTNSWSMVGYLARSDSNASVRRSAGTKPLAGVLERISLSAGGTDTFDLGAITVNVEV